MHEYGLVCPKMTFVHKGDVCAGPKFLKCVSCASEQYGLVRATGLTSGMSISRRSLKRVDRYIAVSNFVATACRSILDSGKQSRIIIPPFVPDELFQLKETTRPQFVPLEGDYLMFAGALSRHKGVDVLLEAWGRLDVAVPLVLVGLRGPDTPRHFPDGVIVVENVPHEEVLRAWQHCTVAVVPSRWPEPFAMAAIEAMAAGRPVIASAVGGLPELIHDGITGVLVSPNDGEVLKAEITKLLAQPELRTRMGRAARERAELFSASAVVPRIEQVYREAVAVAQASHMEVK
jgi:glycosyltransferase involved in cell wall biosynthesis